MKNLKITFNQICLSIILMLLSSNLKADIGYFDIIELKNASEVVYVKIWSPGILKNGDLQYYDWEGNVNIAVEDHLFDPENRNDSIEVFTELVKLDNSIFEGELDLGRDAILYILNKPRKIHRNELRQQFEITDAFNGNTYGYTYTEGISDNDRIWMSDYEVEKLFDFKDYELCSMSLYGIKNNLPKAEQEKLRIEIDTLLKTFQYEAFYEKLKELLKRNIIMIGFCSC